MCKVFKIKTKTGLVTETTDQEIVKCLMDNYNGELTITVNKQKKTQHNHIFTVDEDMGATVRENSCIISKV